MSTTGPSAILTTSWTAPSTLNFVRPTPLKRILNSNCCPRLPLGTYPNLMLLAPALNTTTVIITLRATCDIVVAIEVPRPPYAGIRR